MNGVSNSSRRTTMTMVMAVVMVAVLLASAILVIGNNQGGSEDPTYDYTVRYYAEGAENADDSQITNGYVSVGYNGIISTEYNPEKWIDGLTPSTPVNLDAKNWVGPEYTATAILTLPEVTAAAEYKITLPSKYTPAGWTYVSSGDGKTTWSYTVAESSSSLNVRLEFTDNKVYGGWVTCDGTEQCTITRTVDGNVVTWTYTAGGIGYYKEIYDSAAEGSKWTYEESFDGSSWTSCSKHTDRYYLKADDSYYLATSPLYSVSDSTWTYAYSFTDIDTWENLDSSRTGTDVFGNVWESEGVITSYNVYKGEKEYLPGDVVPNTVHTLRTKWIQQDHFYKNIIPAQWGAENTIDLSSLEVTSKLTLALDTSKWLNIQTESYENSVKTDGVATITLKEGSNSVIYKITFGKDNDSDPVRQDRSMYGTIYYLPYSNGDDGIYNTTDASGKNPLPTGTYSSDLNNKARLYPGTKDSISRMRLGGDAVFDNINFGSNSNVGQHAGSGVGLYACGHTLIIGMGVEMKDSKGGVSPHFQVFGGGSSNLIDNYQDKDMVFSSGKTASVKAVTCVIIHSGVYYNVIAGNYSGDIGQEMNPRSTYLVMKGGAVIDSVFGGNAASSAKIYAGSGDEGTYVYLTGAFMPGDNWVDTKTGDYTGQRTLYTPSKNDVSVIIGGSNKAQLYGSSHVFVTDHASIYDVAGAGRENGATSDSAYVEISGAATVRHAVAGGVMNGMTGALQMVSNTHVVISGKCKVASVYGAGYDIWSEPKGNSMKDGGTITIDMDGGTVGNIFGGGYRGTVGDSNNYKNLQISINISGGRVLDSVYGGGSGGLEKAKHNTNGEATNTGDGGFKDSTGNSNVYGIISLNITGGTIDGNVYGGGKSLPMLSKYNNYSSFTNDKRAVAQVFGTIDVSITDGTIGGSVFGGGRGVEWVYENGAFRIDSKPTLLLMNSSGVLLDDLDWYLKKDGNKYVATYEYNLDPNHIKYSSGTFSGYYLDYAKVSGDVSVSVTGGNIAKSVYGGGAYGKVAAYTQGKMSGSTTVVINGGEVGENVFGGGMGIQGVIAVSGDRNVYVDYSSADIEHPEGNIINGSVYGGSRNGDDGVAGRTSSNTTVVIGQAIIGNPNTGDGSSVYGGGFMGKTYGSTEVYAGYYYAGPVGASAPIINNRGAGHNITFFNSIYAGGDITTEGGKVINPFTEDLVMGDGSVFVYGDGENGLFYIKGSIMGSGNSCNVKGYKSITIDSVDIASKVLNSSPVRMTGIHRADILTISNSELDITSRSTLSEVVGSLGGKDLSVFDIGEMYLKNGTTLTVRAPMDKIVNYYSFNKDNVPTTMVSPSNRLINATGTTFYVRDMIKDVTTGHYTQVKYGNVFGYTLLENIAGQDYGAYVIADRFSTGGFVVAKSGTYREADTTIMDNDSVKCWFLSGTQTKVVTMNLDYKGGNQCMTSASLDIMKMQSGTSIRYTGSTFTSVSTDKDGHDFEFIRPGTEEHGYQFGMVIGYGTSSSPDANEMQADSTRYLQVVDNGDGTYRNGWVSGTYYSEDPEEANGSYEPMVGEETNPLRTLTKLAPVTMKVGSDAGTYSLNLMFTGRPDNTTLYVGYLTISLQEIENVEYEAMDSSGNIIKQVNTMVTNNVNIRVDLYVIGSGSIEDSSTYKVILKGDEVQPGVLSGIAEIIIPKGYISGNLMLTGVSTNQYVLDGQSITIAAAINQDNTTGWMTVNNAVKWTKGGSNEENVSIGTMSGSVVATIRYSIENFTYSALDEGQNPQFVLHFQTTISTSSTPIPSDITVVIDKKPTRTVTYHDDFHNTSGSVQYPDGTYITANSWTTMGSNFIGWYLDDEFVNSFDYNMPITKDMDLYARFSFVVTFDHMNGNSSRMYIAADKEGSLLSEDRMPHPTYYGYDLVGWYKDKTLIVKWDSAFDSVKEDTTLYAKWKGIEVKVNFLYYDVDKKEYVKFQSASDTTSGEGMVAHVMDGTTAPKTVYKSGTQYLDIFGNEYTKNDDGTYTLITEHPTYANCYADANGFLYILKNGTYEACNYGGYVIRWLDDTPYLPTVRYGSNFDTIDSIQSKKGQPVNILDYAEACVKTKIGNDQFVRWQAYYVTEQNDVKTFGVYADTILSSGMVDLTDIGQNGMPEINLYALTAKVAIQLVMSENTEDASAIVAAPAEFLAYPTPTQITRDGNNYFDEPCPYHLDNYVEYEKVGSKILFLRYVDDNGDYYYKVKDSNPDIYISSDGLTLYRLNKENTYYYAQDDENVYKLYEIKEEDATAWYQDIYGNIWQVSTTGDRWILSEKMDTSSYTTDTGTSNKYNPESMTPGMKVTLYYHYDEGGESVVKLVGYAKMTDDYVIYYYTKDPGTGSGDNSDAYYRQTKVSVNGLHMWVHEAKVTLYLGVVYIDSKDGIKYHIDKDTGRFTIFDEHLKTWVECDKVSNYLYKEDDRYSAPSVIIDRADAGLTKELLDGGSKFVYNGAQRTVDFYGDEGLSLSANPSHYATDKTIELTMTGKTANNTVKDPSLWGNITGYGYFTMNLSGLSFGGDSTNPNIVVYQKNTALSLAVNGEPGTTKIDDSDYTEKTWTWKFFAFAEDNYGHDLGILIPQDGNEVTIEIYLGSKASENLIVKYVINMSNVKTVVDLDDLASEGKSHPAASYTQVNTHYVDWAFNHSSKQLSGRIMKNVSFLGSSIVLGAVTYQTGGDNITNHGLSGTGPYSSDCITSGRAQVDLTEKYSDNNVNFYTGRNVKLEFDTPVDKTVTVRMKGIASNNTLKDPSLWGNITGYGFFTMNLSGITPSSSDIVVYQKNTALSLAAVGEEGTSKVEDSDYTERTRTWNFSTVFSADDYNHDLGILIPQDGKDVIIEIYDGSATSENLIVKYVIKTGDVYTVVDLDELAKEHKDYPLTDYTRINDNYKDWSFDNVHKRLSGTLGSNVEFFGTDIKLADEINGTEIADHGLSRSYSGVRYQKLDDERYANLDWIAEKILYDPVPGSTDLFTDQFYNTWQKLTDDIYKMIECNYLWLYDEGSKKYEQYKAERYADQGSVTWIYSKKTEESWEETYKEQYDRRMDIWSCYKSSDNGTSWTSCDKETGFFLITRNIVWKDVSTTPVQYTAERTEVAGEITWMYYDSNDRKVYREVFSAGSWAYATSNDDGSSWLSCSKDDSFHLMPTDSQTKYSKYDDDHFGKHEWLIIPVVKNYESIGNNQYMDQFGSIWELVGDEYIQITSKVWKFDQLYTFEWNDTDKVFIDYEVFGDNKYRAYQEKTVAVDNTNKLSDAEIATIRSTCKIGNDYSTVNQVSLTTLKRAEGEGWSSDLYKEYRVEFVKEANDKYIVYVLQVPGGPTGWITVYMDLKRPNGTFDTYVYVNGTMVEGGLISTFYYMDQYNNKYQSHDNVDYVCFEGSTTYYKFNYVMNEATRNGYKLVGWHNSHVNSDDAMYPSSGLKRDMKIFFGINTEHNHYVIVKEVLNGKDANGDSFNYLTGDYDKYETMSDMFFSYCSYNGRALPRLDDVNKMYNITYRALWEQMNYTITISNSAVGSVDAFLIKDGKRMLLEGTVKVAYGDRIELLYSDMGLYSFSKWVASGEYEILDEYSMSTTLIVRGNCSVTATDISKRVVDVNIRFDAGKLSDYDKNHVHVYLRNTLSLEDTLLTYSDRSSSYESYSGYAALTISDPNEGYNVVVKYDNEEYVLTGFIKVDADSTLSYMYEVISARVVKSITTNDEHPDLENSHVWHGETDMIDWTNAQTTELGVPMLTKIDVNVGSQESPEYKTVASVTRYVGVDATYLQREDVSTIINNPDNGISPVVLTIAEGYQYTVLEGFPDQEGGTHYDINFNYNYHVGYSDVDRIEYFNLNWTRVDKPADIIVIMTKMDQAPSVKLTYVADTPVAHHEYTKDKELVRGDRIWAETESITTTDLGFSDSESTNYSIVGWYLDEQFTQPVTPGMYLDNDFITKIINVVDGQYKYILYAEVKEKEDVKPITISFFEEMVGGFNKLIKFHCNDNINQYTVVINVTPDEANKLYSLVAGPGFTINSSSISGGGEIALIDRVIAFKSPTKDAYTITLGVTAGTASESYTVTASPGFTVNSIVGTAVIETNGTLAFQCPDYGEYDVTMKLRETATGTHTISSANLSGCTITGIGVGSNVTDLEFIPGKVTFQCSDTNVHNLEIDLKVSRSNTVYKWAVPDGCSISNVAISGSGNPSISYSDGVISFQCPDTTSSYTITLGVTVASESIDYVLSATNGCMISRVSGAGVSASYTNGSVSFTCPNGSNDYNVVFTVRSSTPGEYCIVSNAEENYNITGIGNATMKVNLEEETVKDAKGVGLDKNMVYFNADAGDGTFELKLKADSVGKYNIKPDAGYTIIGVDDGLIDHKVKFYGETIEFLDTLEHKVTVTVRLAEAKNNCLFVSGTGYSVTDIGSYGGKVTYLNNEKFSSWEKISGRYEKGLTGEVFESSINGGTKLVRFYSDDSAVFSQTFADYNNVKLTLSGTTSNNTMLDSGISSKWGNITGYGFFNINLSGLGLNDNDHIWIYQRNTALSLATIGEDGTAAVANSPYSEWIRNWAYSSLRFNDYNGDIGILIPQDGSEITIELYVSNDSLPSPYTYNEAKAHLDIIRETQGTLIVKYVIDTSNIKTIINLDDMISKEKSYPLETYSKINPENYRDWSFNYSSKNLSGEVLSNVTFVSSSGVIVTGITHNGVAVEDDVLVPFMASYGLDTLNRGIITFQCADSSAKNLVIKVTVDEVNKAYSFGNYVSGYSFTLPSLPSGVVYDSENKKITFTDTNEKVLTLSVTASTFNKMLYFMPTESGYTIDLSSGSTVDILYASHVYLAQRFGNGLTADEFISEVKVGEKDRVVKFYANDGVRISKTSQDGNEIHLRMEGTTINNTLLDSGDGSVNWTYITGYGFFTINFSGLGLNNDEHIWVYQKNTALSLAAVGEYGTAAVADSPYTERIRNWAFSVLKEDYYPDDLGILIPQDGSEIIIEIYVSNKSLPSPYTYDAAKEELDVIRGTSGTLIAKYVIDTSNIATIVDLDDLVSEGKDYPLVDYEKINPNYMDWSFKYSNKLLSGVPATNIKFYGMDVYLDKKAYGATFIVEGKDGFNTREISPSDVSVTGTDSYKVIMNKVNGEVRSITVVTFGSPTSCDIDIHLDRKRVTLNLDRGMLDTYSDRKDIAWSDDTYEAMYGETVKLPVMKRDGVSMVDVDAWASSPLVTITDNKYTISSVVADAIKLTPKFDSSKLVNAIFSSSAGEYGNGQHQLVVEIQKGKLTPPSFDVDSWDRISALIPQGATGYSFSGYVDTSGDYRTPRSIINIQSPIQLVAVMEPTFHNFTFDKHAGDGMELSARNDSASSMLSVGTKNADLEHHSEISLIIKPTSGRTIDINDINEWVHARDVGFDGSDIISIAGNTIESHLDLFGNRYVNETGNESTAGSRTYSIIWAYEGTYDKEHTQGYYSQYMIDESTSKIYKNVGSEILHDSESRYWVECDADSIRSYFYIKKDVTGTGSDGRFLLAVHKDYVRTGSDYMESRWVPFTGLGEPEKLPEDRGYMYTFSLDQDIDFTAHTTLLSININFVVNGVPVTSGTMSAWGTTGEDTGVQYKYGNNVPMYERVRFYAFDTVVSYDSGFVVTGAGKLSWYTDRACTHEFASAGKEGDYYYYEYSAIEELTLYTVQDLVIVTLKDSKDTLIRGLQLQKDPVYKTITLPGIRAPLYGHLFIGWGTLSEDKHNVYLCGPDSTFNPGSDVNRLDLYAYYVEGGSDQVVPYDGKLHIMDIVTCSDQSPYKQSEAINTANIISTNDGMIKFDCPDTVSDYTVVVKVKATSTGELTLSAPTDSEIPTPSKCEIVGIGEGSTATINSYSKDEVKFSCPDTEKEYTIVLKMRATHANSTYTLTAGANYAIKGVTNAKMIVRISDNPDDLFEDKPLPVLSLIDFVDGTFYYHIKVTSENGVVTEMTDSFVFKINKVELFVIAPSAVFVEGDGKDHFVTSGQVQIIAATADGVVPSPSDIAGVVLDVTMPGYSDEITEVGSVRTAASIYFVEGKAGNYIIHYVDGSLILYPSESARYMSGGY